MHYSSTVHLSYLFSFHRAWQGPPPLLSRKPSECDPTREHVLDGLERMKALACTHVMGEVWNDRMTYFLYPHRGGSDGYCVTVREGKLHDTHQVAFVLAVAAHYDRAYKALAPEWRDTPSAISCKTGLSMIEAQMVYAARIEQPKPKRTSLPHDQRRENERTLRSIRQLITAFDEGLHEEFPLSELRKLVL